MLHGGEIYDKEIKYDFSVNLNPTPCPEEILDALKNAVCDVNKYPDIRQQVFRSAVAEAENKLLGTALLTKENVIGGNGASELMLAVVRMINPRNVLLPEPSFYGYKHALKGLPNINVREFLLEEENDFALTEDFLLHITEDTDLCILANPNNPTGRTVDEKLLEKIIDRCTKTDTWIIIDECFLHLSDSAKSAAKYIETVDKLFIVNAYTKLFSLPGVRIGYAISGKENIEKLRSNLPEWNMSVFALKAGERCARYILDTDFVQISKDHISLLKAKLTDSLRKKGYTVFPSDTCFVLLKTHEDLYNSLLKKGILVRDCRNFAGLKEGYYRISVLGGESAYDTFWTETDFSDIKKLGTVRI